MARRLKRGPDDAADGAAEPAEERGNSKVRWAGLGLALGLAFAALVALERPRGEPAREAQADGTIGGAIRSVAQGVKDTATSVQDGVTGVRTSARNLGLVQQVVARLRGDKMIVSDRIEVSIEGEGTAVLEGRVPDESARDRAVGLARDTRGVRRVLDRLTVTSSPGGAAEAESSATASAGGAVPRR